MVLKFVNKKHYDMEKTIKVKKENKYEISKAHNIIMGYINFKNQIIIF